MDSCQGLVEARLTVGEAPFDLKEQPDSQIDLLPRTGIQRSLTSDIQVIFTVWQLSFRNNLKTPS